MTAPTIQAGKPVSVPARRPLAPQAILAVLLAVLHLFLLIGTYFVLGNAQGYEQSQSAMTWAATVFLVVAALDIGGGILSHRSGDTVLAWALFILALVAAFPFLLLAGIVISRGAS